MTNPGTQPPVILASSSRYRRELLERLQLPFTCISPDVDESPLPNETAQDLVTRLSVSKAAAIAKENESALIIGSDQVAVIDGNILGKPGNHEKAVAQLQQLSGRTVTFYTGLCLLAPTLSTTQTDVVPFHVHFRTLGFEEIERYLKKEQPYDCAGSFRSEALGITLFERMEGDDPTALIGLPLIRLTRMFAEVGVQLP